MSTQLIFQTQALTHNDAEGLIRSTLTSTQLGIELTVESRYDVVACYWQHRLRIKSLAAVHHSCKTWFVGYGFYADVDYPEALGRHIDHVRLFEELLVSQDPKLLQAIKYALGSIYTGRFKPPQYKYYL